ncbi:MAG TPA: PilZ domain-containing protein [Novosphingobium sp.]|nr:PilZ domain-containing protein [Novosphingobium sp.]
MSRIMVRTQIPAAIPAIGRRGRNRLRARLPAKIVTLDGTRNTVLLDVSLTGARIKATENLAQGQQAILAWAEFEAFGRVVWLAHGMCGMAFEEPLEPAALIATRDRDEREHLPSDRDMARCDAREWVDGSRRV